MKSISVLSLIVGSVLTVHGLNVECEAGFLGSKIENPVIVSELVLTGSADASDFYFIGSSMPALRSLDMSGLKIESYSGIPLGAVSYYKEGEIPAAVFAASALTEVVLPSMCTVGNFAFAGCNIKNITIPSGVSIGDGAFSHCQQLTTITIGTGATIGHSAFYDCSMLETVNGSENISVIPARSFEGCAKLEKFDFGSGLKSIGECAFAGTSIKEAYMKSCAVLDSIDSWAFAGDVMLEKVSLPSQLNKIGSGVFFECTALADISLPESITELPAYTFKDATSMKSSFVLPENISSVGEYALFGVSSVGSVQLPASLEFIGEGAMEGMTSLASIDAMSLTSVPALGDDVWYGLDQANVILSVDPSLQSSFESALQWQEFDIQSTLNTSEEQILNEIKIRAAFDDYILIVESTGQTIDSIGVYDVSGMTIYNKSGIESSYIRIDTSHCDSDVYIIDCTLSDGTRGSVKILR